MTHPEPEWNAHDAVDGAIQALTAAADEAEAMEAHDRLLWTVGDSHEGTYFPVVLVVLPALEGILKSGSHWARRAAVECLIDLGGSFIPAEGHEHWGGRSVKEAVRLFLQSLRPCVAPLADGLGAAAESAAELLELIDDQAA